MIGAGRGFWHHAGASLAGRTVTGGNITCDNTVIGGNLERRFLWEPM